MNRVPLPKILVICGPTASGKSDLALRIARECDAEIISADSMQVYRGMSIGTAKPAPEHLYAIPHHLIDVVDPDQPFSAADFAVAADKAIDSILQRGKRVIVAGGTGLYIRALLKGLIDSPGCDNELRHKLQEEASKYGREALLERLRQVDPDLAARLHSNNLVRIVRALEVYILTGIPLSHFQQEHAFRRKRYHALQIGISVERHVLHTRIEERVNLMLDKGLFDEVRNLLSQGFGMSLKSMGSIGYKEVAAHLRDELSRDEAVLLIKRNTRLYAKRQMTWFNADKDILWFEYPEKFVTILDNVIDFFENREE